MSFTQRYSGKSRYHPDYPEAQHSLIVAVLCRLADAPSPFYALLDTGSEWCILSPRVARDLGCSLEPDDVVPPLVSRFGRLHGRFERLPTWLVADEGDDLELDATWFISEDWPGPLVIGWKGCLERFRLALDPGADTIYFGPL